MTKTVSSNWPDHYRDIGYDGSILRTLK